jgi:hypothetical protein
MPAIYSFEENASGSFSLYERSEFLITFTRDSFRPTLESLCRSSNWVGSILRLFLKKYPPLRVEPVRTHFDRVLNKHHESGLAEYLRSKGFRVTERIDNVSDAEIITFLESKGYIVQGLLEGSYYDSTENLGDADVKSNKQEVYHCPS